MATFIFALQYLNENGNLQDVTKFTLWGLSLFNFHQGKSV